MPPAAVLLALSSIALWSFLAYLGARLRAMSLRSWSWALPCASAAPSARSERARGGFRETLLVGVGGIFGFHTLYFTAFQHAPAVEANLINYLWPLLIVLLTPVLLPGNPLRPHNLVGALLGLTGAALIITGGRFSLETEITGRLLANGRRRPDLGLLLAPHQTASTLPYQHGGHVLPVLRLLSLGFSALQPHSFPSASTLSAQEWALLLALGLGPMGAAFYTWDAALNRGDPRIIGSLAYLIPLTSTLVLVVLGGRSLEPIAAAAMILIVAGISCRFTGCLWPKKEGDRACGKWKGNAYGGLTRATRPLCRHD